MTKKQKYLNSEAHGYLLESDACAILIKELERVCTKFQRRIDKETAARQADFDAAMEYHSENEIQDAYGWELINVPAGTAPAVWSAQRQPNVCARSLRIKLQIRASRMSALMIQIA